MVGKIEEAAKRNVGKEALITHYNKKYFGIPTLPDRMVTEVMYLGIRD